MSRRVSSALGGAAAALAVASTPAAHAASSEPLSALQSLAPVVAPKGDPPEFDGVDVTVKPSGSSTWVEVRAKAGSCFAYSDFGYTLDTTYGESSRAQPRKMDLLRLRERAGSFVLERTRIELAVATGKATLEGRSSVPLTEVARSPGGEVVVWAYREGREVVIVSRTAGEAHGAHSPRPSPEEGTSSAFSSRCPFAVARLDARAPEAGTVAQIVGRLPARGQGRDRVSPRFVIDASVARTSRDPEPVLSVRVRLPR